jgi:hypothetical protein
MSHLSIFGKKSTITNLYPTEEEIIQRSLKERKRGIMESRFRKEVKLKNIKMKYCNMYCKRMIVFDNKLW